jgi:3',5'-cyclic AMP phosphodiesterase CpdA
MAAGAGTLWLMKAGVPQAFAMSDAAAMGRAAANDATFAFVQVSDSHIGFKHEPNMDVAGTMKAALDRINAQAVQPDFVVHTGDLTHLSRADEFDTAAGLMQGLRAKSVLYIPGEHDVIGDNGAGFFQRFGQKQNDGGWYSFDYGGAHFVALINVLNLQGSGLGYLGTDQLAWLKKDLAGRSAETPLIVFAHMPMWSLYPSWGWGTTGGDEALSYMKRFGSVTVLNGHIHQIQQKVEGNVTFYTARSTAYPQPAPGVGTGPGPLKDVPAGKLETYLGIRQVRHVQGKDEIAVTEEVMA